MKLGWNTKKSPGSTLSKDLDLTGFVEPDFNWRFFILDNRARSGMIWLGFGLVT